MNAEIQKRLEAESPSDSRGFFQPLPIKRVVTAADSPSNAPTLRLKLPRDVVVEPLAGVDELLDQAESLHR